jgi:hypothetical protein
MTLFLTRDELVDDNGLVWRPQISSHYFAPYVRASPPISPSGWGVINVFQPSGDLLTDYRFPQIPSTGFSDIQSAMLDMVDAKTLDLRSNGFAFSPVSASGATFHFPLDPTSSITWQGMLLAASSLSYPLGVGSVDGPVATLSSPLEVQSFFGSGIARAAEILAGAAYLRSRIIAASGLADLDAIVDTRT